MKTPTQSVIEALTKIADMLEGYASSYATMARQNASDPVVRMTSVEVDIRQNMKGYVLEQLAALQLVQATPDPRDVALAKVNEIRESIIGFQRVGWSEHVYPLVAALDEAGIEGAGYEEAVVQVQKRLDKDAANELAAERYNWLRQDAVRSDRSNQWTPRFGEWLPNGSVLWRGIYTEQEFDQAIDAARGKP